MASILEKIAAQKEVKRTSVRVTISSDLKEKIDVLCQAYDVKPEEYIASLIENSEVNREFNRLKKKREKRKNEMEEEQKANGNSESYGEDMKKPEEKNGFEIAEKM